jgi:hypothetical protein
MEQQATEMLPEYPMTKQDRDMKEVKAVVRRYRPFELHAIAPTGESHISSLCKIPQNE